MRRIPALLVAACLFAPGARAEPVDPALLGEVERRLEAFRERDGFPGALAAFALPDGRVGEMAVGQADPEHGIPMGAEHRSMSGSIGKSFVAATALALHREGVWDLDARVATWLGNEPWFGRLPNAGALTPRILLKHAGGLDDHVEDHMWGLLLRTLWKLLTTGPDAYLSPAESIALVLDGPARFPAGDGYHYTDTGYLIAGLALEKAAGRVYYELLAERFLEPLGLDRTSPADRRELPGLVVGHQEHIPIYPTRVSEEIGRLRFNPAVEWTGGGLVTHPRDLVRWAKALYEERALPGSYLEELLAGPSPAGDDLGYGLGVFVRGQTSLGPTWGHGGFFPGYRAQMQYYPEHRIAVAVQLNRDDRVEPREYTHEIAEIVARAVSRTGPR